jgi:hypothetical protein
MVTQEGSSLSSSAWGNARRMHPEQACRPMVTARPTCGSNHISPAFQALRAEVPDDGGMRRVIGWLRAAITLIIGSANAALRQLGRRSANAAPAAAVEARVKLVDSETRRS